MRKLIERLSGLVKGSIAGFDRIVFKGIILPLVMAKGDDEYMPKTIVAKSKIIIRSLKEKSFTKNLKIFDDAFTPANI